MALPAHDAPRDAVNRAVPVRGGTGTAVRVPLSPAASVRADDRTTALALLAGDNRPLAIVPENDGRVSRQRKMPQRALEIAE
jgi:hypothetical protein